MVVSLRGCRAIFGVSFRTSLLGVSLGVWCPCLSLVIMILDCCCAQALSHEGLVLTSPKKYVYVETVLGALVFLQPPDKQSG